MPSSILESIRERTANFPKTAQARANSEIDALLRANATTIFDLRVLVANRAASVRLRSIACWALGTLPDEGGAEVLLNVFQSDEPKLIRQGAVAIAQIGDSRVSPALIRTLSRSLVPAVRQWAAYALGWVSDSAATEPLMRALLRDESFHVRAVAAEALANLDDERAVPALIFGLNDRHPEVRLWSAYSLGEIGSPLAIDVLRLASREDMAKVRGWGRVSDEAKAALGKVVGTAKGWTCSGKCALRGEHRDCNGYIHGQGSGNTQSDACKAAKKSAGPIPRGCFKGHCQCPKCDKHK